MPIKESVEKLPEEEKLSDPLLNASVRMFVDGEVFGGIVEDIEVGSITRDRLYLVKYTDGDIQHLEREEVLECLISSANNVLKVSHECKIAPCSDVNDAGEQTDVRECFPSEKNLQFSPKKTIKDIAKNSRGNTKPSRASLLTKKPAGR